MTESLTIQGRGLSRAQLQDLRQWVGAHLHWSRWRLSRELAIRWDWRNGAGVLKDMAARTLLVKLAQRGLIGLPARRQVPTNRMRCGPPLTLEWSEPGQAVTGELGPLEPLSLQEVSAESAARAWVKAALARFHYLGFGGVVGENLQYVVRDAQNRPLACLVFGAAAWKCQDRDRFIGWTAEQRQKHLARVANNTRFLILPWVRVPELSSWILGQVARRIGRDWQAKYGHSVVVLETFVEQSRFRGTVYRAANWQWVGRTQGRSRQDRHSCLQVAVKDIYLYPLRRDFRQALQG
ncbi:MAG TPA: Druantia anti-phage system protein DruA [Polyangia bacterium]